MKKAQDMKTDKTWIQLMSLLPSGWVTFGNFLNLSELQFPYQLKKIEDNFHQIKLL